MGVDFSSRHRVLWKSPGFSVFPFLLDIFFVSVSLGCRAERETYGIIASRLSERKINKKRKFPRAQSNHRPGPGSPRREWIRGQTVR